ncbi:hypothetical protein N3K66_003770 [Trichothecium roseum]|uniref:Uncharacterized protein n=1 Tax=Trichothecium roseum TaxID=47278 RepID=A0ACC0V6T2_9HYPO|nr:hypothetical protein N3K66_003770 [Trichothecium roseum]
MQAVASALTSAGHDVLWLTSADNEARVLATGSRFLPTTAVALVDAPLIRGRRTGLLDADSHSRGLEGRLLAQVADYRAALAGFDADVLVVDVLPHGARALHDLGEVPVWATLGVIPMYASSPGWSAPFATSGASPPTTWAGRLWNLLRHWFRRWVVLPWTARRVINRQRSVLGLPGLSYGESLERFTYSRFLHIQASSPTLEFGAEGGLRDVEKTVYVGPLAAPSREPADPFADCWDLFSKPGTRVVGVTQGTLAMDPTSLIIPTIRALAPDPRNLLLVVSPYVDEIRAKLGRIGGKDKEEEEGGSGDDPPNVIYLRWVPYQELLPVLDLLVTNGGYGSITQALGWGVPLLCAGQTEDKKDTAARVAWAGAGVDLGTDNPGVEVVREAAEGILGDEGYRRRAKGLGEELLRMGGGERACRALEELVAEHGRGK